MYLTTAVLGDEQVFDVELDRNTVFLPVREDRRVVSWDQTYDSSLNLREPGGSNNGAGGATSGREQMSGDIPDRTLGKGLRVKEGDDGSDDLTKGQLVLLSDFSMLPFLAGWIIHRLFLAQLSQRDLVLPLFFLSCFENPYPTLFYGLFFHIFASFSH